MFVNLKTLIHTIVLVLNAHGVKTGKTSEISDFEDGSIEVRCPGKPDGTVYIQVSVGGVMVNYWSSDRSKINGFPLRTDLKDCIADIKKAIERCTADPHK